MRLLLDTIAYNPVGIIRTPFIDRKGMPRHAAAAKNVEGTVEIFTEFREGLADLGGFSHILLIFSFHKAKPYSLKVTPPFETEERGVFASRSPDRPNGIGVSVTELVSVEDGTLRIRGVDMLDGTPLLDIKPYVRSIDGIEGEIKEGWMTGKSEDLRKRLE